MKVKVKVTKFNKFNENQQTQWQNLIQSEQNQLFCYNLIYNFIHLIQFVFYLKGTESWDFIHIYNSPHYTMHSNGSLEVHETNRQEAGFYVCQASNGIVPDIGKVIQLTVNGACSIMTMN